jgi:hypothetical protein
MTGSAFQYTLRKETEKIMGLYVTFGIFFVTIVGLLYLSKFALKKYLKCG